MIPAPQDGAPPMPDIEQYQKLLPIAEKLYTHMDQVAQTLLLPLFLFSVLFAYSQDIGLGGAVVSRVKRLLIAALLLAAFPTLSSFIRDVGQEIALSIDNLGGLDEIMRAASAKAKTYSVSAKSLFDLGQSLATGFLISCSFTLLFFARFGIVAFYHFYWLVLLVTAPLMILCYLFEATSGITRNLFKNLILVACWPIIWAILSAFLKGLPFAQFYGSETPYVTVCVMNLIIVASLLLSPFMLTHFCDGMIVGAGSTISAAAKTVFSKGLSQATNFASPYANALTRHLTSPTRGLPKPKAPEPPVRKLPMGIALLLLSFAAHAQERTVQIQPGLSTLLCLKQAPRQAALGDPKYFRVEAMGKNLILRTIEEDHATNLIVYFGENLFESYALKSSKIMPHMAQVGCDQPAPMPVKKASLVARPSVQSVSDDGVILSLLAAVWSSPQRDHLTLKLRIENSSDDTLEPDWKRTVLLQAGRKRPHSKLWSERRSLEPSASSLATLQFTRPGLGPKEPVLLEIPRFRGASLRLNLSSVVTK